MGLKGFFFKQIFWMFLPRKKLEITAVPGVIPQSMAGLEFWD